MKYYTLDSLKSLNSDRVQIDALRHLSIRTISDLASYKLFRNAEILVDFEQRNKLHELDLSNYLDSEFASNSKLDIANLSIESILNIGPEIRDHLFQHFNISTLSDAKLFEPYVEATKIINGSRNDFYERPSAPPELIPEPIGSISSNTRYSSFIVDKNIGAITIEINDDCLIPLAITNQDAQLYFNHSSRLTKPKVILNNPINHSEFLLHDSNINLKKIIEKFPNLSNLLAGNTPSLSDAFTQVKCPKIKLGYIVGHSQKWTNMGTHLGEVKHSVCLAPAESRNISVVNWRRNQTTGLNQNTHLNENLNSKFSQKGRRPDC